MNGLCNPQIENGYTKIANETIEALSRTQLSGYESRIVWAIFRKTYGYGKKEDWISTSQFVAITGLNKTHISRTINNLIKRKIVTKIGNKISFNKLYTQWAELPKLVTVTKIGNKVTKIGNSELPKLVTTKETITKENIQKKVEPFFQNQKLNQIFGQFIEHRKQIKKPMTDNAKKLMVKKLKQLSTFEDEQMQILERSIMNGWAGIFELKEKKMIKFSDLPNPEAYSYPISKWKELEHKMSPDDFVLAASIYVHYSQRNLVI